MKLTTHPNVLVDRAHRAFDGAVDDTLELARAKAVRRLGRFAGSLTRTPTATQGDRLTARIGSPLSSARAHERGAFASAKSGSYMVFDPGGGWVKVASVQIPARPAVLPAGREFPRLMSARLRSTR